MPPADDGELSAEERLRLQNELTRAELEDAHGAFFGEGETSLPPELEAQFLNRVRAMEAGGAGSYVPIGSLIDGAAVEAAVAKAKGGDLQAAADDLVTAALEAGIVTEAPTWIEPGHWFHFLTHDFLEHAVPAPPPPPADDGSGEGPMRHVVAVLYDQVRQDGPEFLGMAAEGFLQDLLHPGRPFTGELLAHTCRDGAEVVPREVAYAKIRAWKERWTEIVPVGFGLGGLVEDALEQGTFVQFGCAYTVTDKEGHVHEFDGPGVMQFAVEGKGFKVVGCVMDGFEM